MRCVVQFSVKVLGLRKWRITVRRGQASFWLSVQKVMLPRDEQAQPVAPSQEPRHDTEQEHADTRNELPRQEQAKGKHEEVLETSS